MMSNATHASGEAYSDTAPSTSAIDQAEIARLTQLVERPELIQSMTDCSDVLNFLESKIASIEGQLETSRIAASQRGASDHYLDWHIRAHHALSVSQMQHRRVLKRRGVLNHIEVESRKEVRAFEIETLKREQADAAARRAEASARNAQTQLQIVSVASERSVHRKVCQLVQQKFGEDIHRELFDLARRNPEVSAVSAEATK
ncbi:hypothetical protein [Gluconobacter cerinus]|uniref:Uncharacterized protein n=1 Tax=Gluconobacter cerinus TaxID=38307 RepID=A0A1B6VP79_9PROT|nr:hypothetical protein [Gluconobacter cerinus]OAJ69015.1 hypothetical protein A0123_00585 [Gluconobacter cerinus]